MSDDTADASMTNTLATATGSNMLNNPHDQQTIQQQNNSQQNEIIQQLIEARRQNAAEFEQRMRQQDQLFQTTMQMLLANNDRENARAAGLQTQQQSYTHQEAEQSRAQTSADLLATLGILTPWLP